MSPDDILGAWELQSYRIVRTDGAVYHPLGEDAAGLLMYTADGFMSAHLMSRHRPDYDLPKSTGGTEAQSAAAARGYLGYAGSFVIDEQTDTVHHHVRISLLPNWLGGEQIRHGQLDGKLLVLTAATELSGVTATATLIWARPQQVSGK